MSDGKCPDIYECRLGINKILRDNVNLKRKLAAVRRERNAYKRVAEEWMRDYDKLKEKYEPTIIVTSEVSDGPKKRRRSL